VSPAQGAVLLVALVGAMLPLPGSLGQAGPAPRSQPRKARQCDSSRYGCVGKRPADFDRDVQVAHQPIKGMDTACMARLRQAKVAFRMLKGVKGVRSPVEVLTDRLGGVLYRRAWNNKRRFIIDCRMVEALVVLGRSIRRAGVASVYFSSTWRYTMIRGQGRLSQHAYGLAVDLIAIDGAFGYASVVRHYEKGVWGCGERNKTPKGAAWRKLFCVLGARGAFVQVFTPDTDQDHRDHWHVEQPGASLRLPPPAAQPAGPTRSAAARPARSKPR
jgi:hypothetical protein